ncbi:MAG: transposase [Cyanobacteria bacterium J06581_3]
MATDETLRILAELGQQVSGLMQRVEKLEAENAELKAENAELKAENAELKAENAELKAENKALRELLNQQGKAKASKTPTFSEDYSVERNQGKPKSKRGKQATGRRPHHLKLELVDKHVTLYEPGVSQTACVERGVQYGWRLVGGQAKYICYHLYALPQSSAVPTVAGLRTRQSEYGREIILTVAFLHYWTGISLDHVCSVMQFFTGLALSKSQANALLNQLSDDWDEQYDTIAELLSRQLVIYIDETGWRVGSDSCYTWAFSSAMHVLFRCGVGRGKAEAEAILGDAFMGIGVTDDYGAYRALFLEHQLCWAHLLRKAIKLMLQHPDEVAYKRFLDELYAIYQQAIRWQKDQRLTVGRGEKIILLQDRICELCELSDSEIDSKTMSTHEQSFIRLQKELIRGLDALFVFVAHPEVEPTNNRSERNVRHEAMVRKGGRTSKSQSGATRRGVIMTVLATLNTRLEAFTLNQLIDEIKQWTQDGLSRFQEELAALGKALPPPITAQMV